MNQLQRLEITVPAAAIEPLTGFLFQKVKYGWEEEDVPLDPDGRRIFRVHIENEPFAQDLAQELAARFPDAEIGRDSVPNQDWTTAWREFFTAVPAGAHFIVVAPWMQDHLTMDRTPIVIEPKMAFGTGHHATTALCLSVVSDLFDAGRLKPGMRFLDLGTGSGILGLGCAKLGLVGVGVDIDPLAIDNALENKTINGIDDTAFRVGAGSVNDLEALGVAAGDTFDLILANILAEPLKTLAPEIVRRLAQGGCLVLSGLLRIQADDVKAAYLALGLPEPELLLADEWGALYWT